MAPVPRGGVETLGAAQAADGASLRGPLCLEVKHARGAQAATRRVAGTN
jgi:hypothetical protein